MWYVVQTTSGREQAAVEKCKKALSRDIAADLFVPVCQFEKLYQKQWKMVTETAFPGYVFIESTKGEELEKMLRRIADVVTPVCIGGGFYPIRAEEEEVLRTLMDENDCIRTSVGYLVDEKLIVSQGPLDAFSESVKWINRHKRVAEIEISLFNEPRKMWVGLEVKGKMTGEEYKKMLESA